MAQPEINQNNQLTVSWSINTLNEDFKDDMDAAVSIERRLAAMKQVYDAGIRTVCFISPVFPGITDIEVIIERAKYPDLVPLYHETTKRPMKESPRGIPPS